jgi:hypothetical protein
LILLTRPQVRRSPDLLRGAGPFPVCEMDAHGHAIALTGQAPSGGLNRFPHNKKSGAIR